MSVKLSKIKAGVYETADGRFVVIATHDHSSRVSLGSRNGWTITDSTGRDSLRRFGNYYGPTKSVDRLYEARGAIERALEREAANNNQEESTA